jgi:hypothetical protein
MAALKQTNSTDKSKDEQWAAYRANKASKGWGKPLADAPKKEFKVIDNAKYELSTVEFLYPFADLADGQGFFIPLEANNTMDKLVLATHKQVTQFRTQNSEVEKNDEGDDILESFTVNVKVRNPDGSIVMDGDSPKLTVSSGLRPKLIGPNFAVRVIHKDDEIGKNIKAEGDGVLVIRLN